MTDFPKLTLQVCEPVITWLPNLLDEPVKCACISVCFCKQPRSTLIVRERDMSLMQELMTFVLTKAAQVVQGVDADAQVCMSAVHAIVQVCQVAESHSMPMPVATLDGLLQLTLQAAHPDVCLRMS